MHESRDRACAARAKESKINSLAKERSLRVGYDALEELFDAVADGFVELMQAGHPFAFKYCPTPGCSADKGTGGSGGGGGIAWAVMERMGFPGIGLDHVSLPWHWLGSCEFG